MSIPEVAVKSFLSVPKPSSAAKTGGSKERSYAIRDQSVAVTIGAESRKWKEHNILESVTCGLWLVMMVWRVELSHPE